MFFDVVFPKGNEKEFVGMAGKLEIDGLCFVYPYDNRKKIEEAKNRVLEMQKSEGMKLKAIFLAEGTGIYKVHDSGEMVLAEASEKKQGYYCEIQTRNSL